MKRCSPKKLLLTGAPGLLLQLAGLVCAALPGRPELGLAVGLATAAVGTLALMLALEQHLLAIGRRDRWALCALAGPPGLAVVASLGNGSEPGEAAAVAPPSRTLTDRLVATLLLLAMAAGFVWGGMQWAALDPPGTRSDPGLMRHNERLAFIRLGQIARAQQLYRQKDRDGDGNKTYARFLIHLWQSVHVRDGRPLPLRLISRELGFAMVSDFALDGYYYQDVHTGGLIAGIKKQAAASARELDPAREWAVAAIPKRANETGLLGFVAHSSGSIWTQDRRRRPGSGDAAKPRWIEVKSTAALEQLQKATSYP